MKMKKSILAVVLAAAVGIIGLQQASARVLDLHGDRAPRFEQLDDATKAKMEKFRADTQDLRKQMVMKRAEERALMRSESLDVDAVRKAAGELFDMRIAMQEKARTAGLFAHPKRGADDGKITEEREKFDKFLTDTQDLRKQMSVKRAEERALMHSRNANAGAVAKVAGELFDLRNTIHEKARTSGFTMPFRGMGQEKIGPGRHFLHGGGFGMMECPGPQGLGMMGADEPVDEEEII
jgi:hypothetical protein